MTRIDDNTRSLPECGANLNEPKKLETEALKNRIFSKAGLGKTRYQERTSLPRLKGLIEAYNGNPCKKTAKAFVDEFKKGLMDKNDQPVTKEDALIYLRLAGRSDLANRAEGLIPTLRRNAGDFVETFSRNISGCNIPPLEYLGNKLNQAGGFIKKKKRFEELKAEIQEPNTANDAVRESGWERADPTRNSRTKRVLQAPESKPISRCTVIEGIVGNVSPKAGYSQDEASCVDFAGGFEVNRGSKPKLQVLYTADGTGHAKPKGTRGAMEPLVKRFEKKLSENLKKASEINQDTVKEALLGAHVEYMTTLELIGEAQEGVPADWSAIEKNLEGEDCIDQVLDNCRREGAASPIDFGVNMVVHMGDQIISVEAYDGAAVLVPFGAKSAADLIVHYSAEGRMTEDSATTHQTQIEADIQAVVVTDGCVDEWRAASIQQLVKATYDKTVTPDQEKALRSKAQAAKEVGYNRSCGFVTKDLLNLAEKKTEGGQAFDGLWEQIREWYQEKMSDAEILEFIRFATEDIPKLPEYTERSDVMDKTAEERTPGDLLEASEALNQAVLEKVKAYKLSDDSLLVDPVEEGDVDNQTREYIRCIVQHATVEWLAQLAKKRGSPMTAEEFENLLGEDGEHLPQVQNKVRRKLAEYCKAEATPPIKHKDCKELHELQIAWGFAKDHLGTDKGSITAKSVVVAAAQTALGEGDDLCAAVAMFSRG